MIRSKNEVHDDVYELQNCFRLHGLDSSLYKQSSDESVQSLFESVALTIVHSEYLMQKLPVNFTEAAQGFAAKESETLKHFSDLENMRFMLSDLFDYLELVKRGLL